MLNRQPVLVAIDHATDIERALDVARSLAEARGADVDVIQVVPRGAVLGTDRRLASMPRAGDPEGVHVRSVTLRGRADRVIPAYSQLRRAAILVVERDYGSSRFWRHGRVVDALARQSPAPLLVLPKRKASGRREREVRRILTAVDFTTASAVAVRTAVDLSRREGAHLTLVHALRDIPRHMVFSASGAWDVVRRLPAQLDAAAARLRRTATSMGANHVDTEVATGDAGRAILEIAARTRPDLIVMGTTHRSRIDRVLFGSTLRRVLRRATVPTLVVPVVAGARAQPEEGGFHQNDSSLWAKPAFRPRAA